MTRTGTLAGCLGALIIALTSVILLPFCPATSPATGMNGDNGWGWREKGIWILAITAWGGMGSLVDSALGGWLQASVVDTRTGKIIEGTGGQKVSSIAPVRYRC